MEIKLTLEDKEVELSESSAFAITREFEHLSDPTKINNSWSKSYKIPFTVNNNNVFNNIFNIERAFTDARTLPNVDINFNPARKINFKLFYNESLVMRGYARLQEVDNISQTYTINLFGELGNTFHELLQCYFKNTSYPIDDKDIQHPEYIIDLNDLKGLEDRENFVLDRNMVKKSWDRETTVISVEDPNCQDVDYFGFFPTWHGKNEDFDCKTIVNSNGVFKSLATILGDKLADEDFSESLLGDGLWERQMGEFRSKYQKPYIYVNKLWQIMEKQSKLLKEGNFCKYPLHLDKSWFNNDNPYYTDMVYICNYLKFDNTTTKYTKSTTSRFPINNGINNASTRTFVCSSRTRYLTANLMTTIPETIPTKNNWRRVDPDHYYPILDVNLALKIEVRDKNGVLLCTKTIRSANPGTTLSGSVPSTKVENGYWVLYTSLTLNRYLLGNEAFTVTVQWVTKDDQDVSNHFCYYWWRDNATQNGYQSLSSNYNSCDMQISGGVIADIKDGFKFTDLWNPETSVFEVLLNYAKMFGLQFIVDDRNGWINVTTRSSYFQNYKIEDWSDKVNFSEIFTIKQPTFESKYIQWNFDKGDTDICNEYNNVYQREYGSYLRINNFEFNEDVKKMFSKVKPFNMISPTMATWWTYYDDYTIGDPLLRYYTTEIYMDELKGDKSADISYCFAFRCKNQTVDSRLTSAKAWTGYVFITDDTNVEKSTDTYCYHDLGLGSTLATNEAIKTNKIPLLSYIDQSGEYGCLFELPKSVHYNTASKSYSNAKFIYELFWKDYIEERYNVQNKVITCKANISHFDYSNFDFNHFIRIGNGLYMINKIFDYSLSDAVETKIELCSIHNIPAYTSGLAWHTIDITPSGALNITTTDPNEFIEDRTGQFTVYSSDPWEFTNSTNVSLFTFSTREGNAGTTTVYVTGHGISIPPAESSSMSSTYLTFTSKTTGEVMGTYRINREHKSIRQPSAPSRAPERLPIDDIEKEIE